MSGEHLRRLCLAGQGCSPMGYVTALRMRRASVLLRTSQVKIEAIATEVGYGGIYAFSTAFKRWSGVPPRAWRKTATSAGA
jgi:AraC-like DNA-binding protein